MPALRITTVYNIPQARMPGLPCTHVLVNRTIKDTVNQAIKIIGVNVVQLAFWRRHTPEQS